MSRPHPGAQGDVDVSTAEVAERHARGEIQLLDVREDYEWEAGRIPGARHVVLAEVARRADALDAERPVVFYCRVGGRSAMAAMAFRRAGYDAWSMAGGLEAWAAERRPLEPQDGAVAPH